jgi:hypothetical protein
VQLRLSATLKHSLKCSGLPAPDEGNDGDRHWRQLLAQSKPCSSTATLQVRSTPAHWLPHVLVLASNTVYASVCAAAERPDKWSVPVPLHSSLQYFDVVVGCMRVPNKVIHRRIVKRTLTDLIPAV